MRLTKLQWAVHLGALLDLSWLAVSFFTRRLGANPIRELTLRTGLAAFILLGLSLACTPLNAYLGWRGVMGVRRALGLYACLFAGLHLAVFLYDYGWIAGEGFDPTFAYQALFEKRYALAGLAAFLILVPLAVTSTRGWVRRLGPRWQPFHRLVYVAALLASLHFVWQTKADLREPLIYSAAIVALLLLRLPLFVRSLRLRRSASHTPPEAARPSDKVTRS
jgi:methionine sulfoxide reductase heme-binding subunit